MEHYPFYEEGGTCPCGGTMELHYPDDQGCYCHISPPCGRCTSSTTLCRECGLVCEEIWEICEQFDLDQNVANWNQLHYRMFNMTREDYVDICERYELPLDHKQWSNSEQVLFRLAA